MYEVFKLKGLLLWIRFECEFYRWYLSFWIVDGLFWMGVGRCSFNYGDILVFLCFVMVIFIFKEVSLLLFLIVIIVEFFF